jgi:hypothetical protein
MLADYQAHWTAECHEINDVEEWFLPSERFETKVTFQPEKDASE